MANRNIEINYKTNEGYDILYPNITARNVIDFNDDVNLILKNSTKALYGLGNEAVPDDVFNKLTETAFIKKVTTTVKHKLSNLAQMDTFTVGNAEFAKLKKDYVPGGTLVWLYNHYKLSVSMWNSSGYGAYDGSTLDLYLQNDLFPYLPNSVQNSAMMTEIQVYTDESGEDTGYINRKIFAISAAEANEESMWSDGRYITGITGVSGVPYSEAWTRTPAIAAAAQYISNVNSKYALEIESLSKKSFKRPYACLVLPNDFEISEEQVESYQMVDMKGTTVVGAQIVGKYRGIGTSGLSNSNSLTFPFSPKLLIITANIGTTLEAGNVFIRGQTNSAGIGANYSSGNTFDVIVSWGDNTISWYTRNTSPDDQMNASGVDYYYFAIA